MTDETRKSVVSALRLAFTRKCNLTKAAFLINAEDGALIYNISRDARQHAESLDNDTSYHDACATAADLVEQGRWP